MKHFAAPDGRRLAWRDSGGEGPPVLCLAGLTRNGRDFDALAAHLAPRHRVIRLDSRGRGGSDHAADPVAEYTVPVETGDALALLDHLGLARVAVVGTSRGGILGMAMAAALPGRVAGLVLNDVGAAIRMAGLRRIAGRLDAEPDVQDFAAAAARLRMDHAADFPDVPPDRWQVHARALYRDESGRPALDHDPRLRETVLAGLDPQVDEISLWPLFETLLATPILVIRGANSDILDKETVTEMTIRHPRLQTLEVAGRGHAPFLDEPEALAAIDGFLGEVCA